MIPTTPKQKTILYYLNNHHSIKEIAKNMNVSSQAIYKTIGRMKKKGIKINRKPPLSCYFCGYNYTNHKHHIIPKSKGGTNDKNNMLSLCPNHHTFIHYENYRLKKILKSYYLINDKRKKIILSRLHPISEKLILDMYYGYEIQQSLDTLSDISQDTHPFISTGTKEHELGSNIEKIHTEYDKVPLEQPLNQMSVGTNDNYCFYQPHNLRLYFDFDKRNFYKPKLGITEGGWFFKIINHSELLFLSDNFNMKIKKTCIEITNKVEHKKWYKISIGSNVDEEIEKIIEKKIKESILALRKFVQQFGGETKYQLVNMASEDKIMGENALSYIPNKMKFNNKFVKKVYADKSVEFKNPGLAINYITNRAVESVVPELGKELKEIKTKLDKNEQEIKDVLHTTAQLLHNTTQQTSNNLKQLTILIKLLTPPTPETVQKDTKLPDYIN